MIARTLQRLPRRVTLESSVTLTLLVAEVVLSCAHRAGLELLAAIGMGLAGVLSRWRPAAGLVSLGFALCTLVMVPPSQVALSVYFPLVAVVFRLQDGAVRLAAVVTCGGLAAALWASRRAQRVDQWSVTCALWLVLYVLAWGLGWRLGQISVETREAHAAELAAQRRTIAAELHDNVAHELTLMVLRAESGRKSPLTAMAELEAIARSGRRANEQLRVMMRLLHVQDRVRPLRLDDALDDTKGRLTRAGVTTNISIEGDLATVSESAADCLARVVREATNNVIRHGDPSWPCAIFVEVVSDRVRVAVLNRRAHPSRPTGEGLGLDGMEQRVEAIGGRLWVGPQAEMWLVRVDLPTDA